MSVMTEELSEYVEQNYEMLEYLSQHGEKVVREIALAILLASDKDLNEYCINKNG